jgi:hypothetical protein
MPFSQGAALMKRTTKYVGLHGHQANTMASVTALCRYTKLCILTDG